jgi:hypothetical protein
MCSWRRGWRGSLLREKYLDDGDWRYTKAYRRAYLAVGKKDPTRIRA